MSNVKVILVDGGEGWEKFTPTAIWYARRARAIGGRHGHTQTFQVDDVVYRVLLDDFTGDKVFVQPAPCAPILYSGFIDTYRAWDTYPLGISLRAQELQEDDENLPRMRNGVWIEGDPTMNGFRHAKSVSGEYPKVHLNPPPANVETLRKFFDWYKPTRFTGLMRRVLQVTFATESWVDALTYQTGPEAPRQFRFDYKWGNSWGVILGPGKDGSSGGHYFLIQILASEVRWVPAKFCVSRHEVGGQKMFAPRLISVDPAGAVSLGLLQYSGTSQFETIGWSFSYTTQEASAVLYDVEEPFTSPRLFTELATVKIEFTDEAPSAVELITGGRKRMWHSLSHGAVQGLGYDVVGNVALRSLQLEWEGGPSPADRRCKAPVHVFYTVGGGREVVEFEYDELDDYTKSYSTPAGAEVGAIYPTGSTPYSYSPIALDYSGALSSGSGSVVYASCSTHQLRCHDSGVTTERPTPAVTDSRTTYDLILEVDPTPSASVGYNQALDFTVRAGNLYTVYNATVAMFAQATGSKQTRAVSATSSVCLVPDDAEAVVVASFGHKDSVTDNRSFSWLGRRKYPANRVTSVEGASLLSPAPPFGYWPGLSATIGVTTSPPDPAPDGYYYGSFLNLSNVTDPVATFGAEWPGAALPTPASAHSGRYFEMLAVVTSAGVLAVDRDPVAVMQTAAFHNPAMDNDSYAPVFLQTAFASDGVSRYVRKNDTANAKVVHIDGKEYNVDKYVNGWIGVV